MNKYLIPGFAAVMVLTMFPLLFFGVVRSVEKDPSSMLLTVILGMSYMFASLFFSYLAVQNREKPLKGYLFLLIPLVVLLIFYFR